MKAILKTIASLALLALAPARGGVLPPAQEELVETERAFVRLAEERGFRDSFFTYFAEDGIAFTPHPTRAKASLANEPSVPGPMGAVWAPVYGDISQAGDLGWNTGPLVFQGKDGEPDRHGMFFSVWKRQADGSWRVVLDVGVGTPSAVVPLDAPFQTSYRPPAAPPPQGGVSAAVNELLSAEREFLAAAESESLGRAYAGRLDDAARIHWPRAMPVVGRAALDEWASAQGSKLRGKPHFADVASSGDLGYAYGSYESEGAAPAAGYYARVWKRDARGDWRIVFDTSSPLPPGVKPVKVE